MGKLIDVIAVKDPNRKVGELYQIEESQIGQFTKLGYAKLASDVKEVSKQKQK